MGDALTAEGAPTGLRCSPAGGEDEFQKSWPSSSLPTTRAETVVPGSATACAGVCGPGSTATMVYLYVCTRGVRARRRVCVVQG